MNITEKWKNLAKSLYIEIVLDATPNATRESMWNEFETVNLEGVQKLIQVFDWTFEGSISEQDFSDLYKVWTKSSSEITTRYITQKESFPLAEFESLIRNHSEKDLDLMLGLLINEHNRVYVEKGCSLKWLQIVEQLFFMLDVAGFGFITVDGTFNLSSFLLIYNEQ